MTSTTEPQREVPGAVELPVHWARRRGTGAVAVAVLVVLLAEFAVRLASGALAPPLEWRDWEARNKARRVAELGRDGGASTVVLGSSMANVAVDAEALAARLRDTRPPFNAGLDGSDLRTVVLWGSQAIDRLRPDVVVIGVSSREINDAGARQDAVYTQFVDAVQGGRLAGRRLARLEAAAGRVSELFRRRLVLRSPTTAFDDPIPARHRVSRLGTTRDTLDHAGDDFAVPADMRRRGFEEALGTFRIGGEQVRALDRLLDHARDRGAEAVIVDMPITGHVVAAHPRGERDFGRYQTLLRRIADDHGARYVDLSHAFTESEFRDPFHLNGTGRARFTELLADAVASLRSAS